MGADEAGKVLTTLRCCAARDTRREKMVVGGTNKKHDVTYKIDPHAPQVCSSPRGLSLLSCTLHSLGLQLGPQTHLLHKVSSCTLHDCADGVTFAPAWMDT